MKKIFIVLISFSLSLFFITPFLFSVNKVKATVDRSAYPYFFQSYVSNTYNFKPQRTVYFKDIPTMKFDMQNSDFTSYRFSGEAYIVETRYDSNTKTRFVSGEWSEKMNLSFTVYRVINNIKLINDDGEVSSGDFYIKSSNFKIDDNVKLDESNLGVPLQVISCEYVKNGNFAVLPKIAKGGQYACAGQWIVKIKNNTNYDLPVYFSADYSSYSGSDTRVNDAEHITNALYSFHKGYILKPPKLLKPYTTSSGLWDSCAAMDVTTITINCDGMPYPDGDSYYFNVWNGFGLLADGAFQGGSTSHTSSSGASHGGIGGSFGDDSDSGGEREIEDYGYKCIYSQQQTFTDDADKWETNPIGDDNIDDWGFDDNGPGAKGFELSATIAKKFPFCLPFDLYNAFKMLIVPAKVPEFNIDFKIPLSKYVGGGDIPFKFKVDFKDFEKIAILTRWGSTFLLSLVLIKLTPNYVKGVK